ncbi:MAG: serine hydrolase domain-containing protein [Armatimonas sp.]
MLPLLLTDSCFLLPGTALAQTEKAPTPVALPDTPAGKRIGEWLAALNSGERTRMRQFLAANSATPATGTAPIDAMTNRQMGFYPGSGGYEIGKIVATPSPSRITVALKAKRTGYWLLVGLSVTPEAPYTILGFGFRNTEAPAELLPPKKLTEREIRTRADVLINKLIAADQFSGVILVAKDGKPVYQRAVGLASRAWNLPNRMDTRFNLGSINKMFTAVAIAQLVEQGKLSYSDTLEKALPDYPNREIAQKVTVRHLLSHTSGITETKSLLSGDAFRQEFRNVNDYLRNTAADTLKFEPGTRLEYSSYTYLILGAIIEKASGQSYFDYVREHIYKPAGMTASDSYDLDTDPPNLATGYMDAEKGTRLSNIQRLPIRGMPFGLGYATAGDLVRFSTALREHKLLNAASLETVWTGVMDYTEFGSKYGYGFIVKTYNGQRIVGHGGGWVGITNKFDMYPDSGYTVVILNNIDSDPNSVAFKFREWLTQGGL